MSETFRQDVFISFSFKDQEVVEKIVNQLLNKYHITYWICTRNIRAGEHYKRTIAEAIKSSKVFVLMQSKSSMASEEVPKEVSIALAKNITVLPFVIEDSELTGDLEYDLLTVQHIDATRPSLDDRIAELAKQIYDILGRSPQGEGAKENSPWRSEGERLLSTPSVIPKNIFCGRDDVLSEIDQRFENGERVLFLTGIGGIGKTQIAKQYAKRFKEHYDTIIYATYSGSLKELIISEAPFEIVPEMIRQTAADGAPESDDAFFARKLNKIKKCTDERTLIIIDNFDVENDELLPELIDGKYHLLITTRFDYSRLYPTVKIKAMDSIENLVAVFMQNYQGYEVEEDDPDLISLIELVNRHTYTIELLAQHMENSGQTAGEMMEALKKEGILSLNEQVQSADMKTQTAYENLLKMFKIFSLSEEERRVLLHLSLMPICGVNAREFKGWCGLESLNIIKALDNKSWIVKNTEGIALHPIIREVVKHELPANEENCLEFLQRFSETIDERSTWHCQKADKDRYATIALSILESFPNLSSNTVELYKNTETLLSFGIKPQMAAKLAERLYRYFGETQGENAFDTGWAAFKTGWVYMFNGYLPNCLENAKEWLEKSYTIFQSVEKTSNYHHGIYSQMLQNLSKLHLRLYHRSNSSEDCSMMKKYAETAVEYSRKFIESGTPQYPKVAGASLQLAEFYTAIGEFEQAIKLIDDAYDILYPLFGENDSDTMFTLSRKAFALYGLNRSEEALALTEVVIKGYDKLFNEISFQRYEMLVLKLKCHLALEQQQEAHEVYRYTLRIGEGLFAPGAAQLKELKALLDEE